MRGGVRQRRCAEEGRAGALCVVGAFCAVSLQKVVGNLRGWFEDSRQC